MLIVNSPFKRRSWSLIVATIFLACVASTQVPAQSTTTNVDALPHWIGPPTTNDVQTQLTRRFTIDEPVTAATLRLAGDFCRTTLVINGQPRVIVEPYCPTQDIVVTDYLQRGANELTLLVDRRCGPAAVAATLIVERAKGEPTRIVTDAHWTATTSASPQPKPVDDRGAVRPELWGVGRRSITISPFENYEQWQQSKGGALGIDAAKLTVPPGFKVTLVRHAQPDEGSWISMAFDKQGRITISREEQGLLRFTLDKSRQTVTKAQSLAVNLVECRGLLYDGDNLYASANRAKGMFRLRLNDAGECVERQELRHFEGKEGHGRNDLTPGGQQKFYAIFGDSVDAPGVPIHDRTSPLRESRRGKPQKEGFVIGADADFKNCELYCTGLRNPYGIACHPSGDLFTYDADNEYDMGLPWYRPTRIVQLIPGADYGYREANGRMPGRIADQPDFAPATLDIGRGSPTAAMFGTPFKFPREYRDALYVLDWSYGRVLAVHLAPRGIGYRAAAELFAQGRPLNVTDIAAGPDGAMYLITGGRKTQSALYRIEYTGDLNSEPPPLLNRPQPDPSSSNHETGATFFWTHLLRTRSKLASAIRNDDPDTTWLAWSLLTDPDPLLRSLARTAVEQQPIDSWQQRALDEPLGRRSLAALLSLVQGADAKQLPAVLDRLLEHAPDKLALPEQFTWLRILELIQTADPALVEARLADIKRPLLAALATSTVTVKHITPLGTSDEWRRRLARMLGELQVAELIPWVVTTLWNSPVQEDRLTGLVALRNHKHGWTIEQRQQYFAELNDSVKLLGGQGLPIVRDKLRTDAIASLSSAELAALGDLVKERAAVDEPLPPARAVVQRWTLADLAPLYENDARGGDATRGQNVFRDALCMRCHRSGLRGAAVGPELTMVARRFSRRDMLESIVAPSLTVAENYRNAVVETHAGQVHTGRVVSEGDFRAQTLRLNTDPLRPSQFIELDKRDIAEHRTGDTSPMP
ncbi:MAG: c-type cytochrome, partial [Planctomycetaceae bacterium]|nr:c-type cytochrome [Planctomycetaceae bacterium]